MSVRQNEISVGAECLRRVYLRGIVLEKLTVETVAYSISSFGGKQMRGVQLENANSTYKFKTGENLELRVGTSSGVYSAKWIMDVNVDISFSEQRLMFTSSNDGTPSPHHNSPPTRRQR